MVRYEMAIVLPDDDSNSVKLFLGSVLINTLTSSLLFLIIIFIHDWLAEILNLEQSMSFILLLVPLSIFLLSTGYAANFLLVKKKRFKASSINKVSRRISEGGMQVFSGVINLRIGLIWGDLIGHVVNVSMTLYQIKRAGYKLFNHKVTEIKQQLINYQHFPKYNALPTLLNSVGLLFPVLLISSKFSSEITGQYDLSRQVLALPLVIISTSISQVLFQRLSEFKNANKSIKGILTQVFVSLSTLSLIGIIIFYLIGVEAFEIIFGDQWKDAALYSEILIIAYALKFVVSTLSISLTALEKLKPLAIWQIMYFSLIVMLVFVGDIEILDFLKVLVVIELFSYTIFAIIIYRMVQKYEVSLRI